MPQGQPQSTRDGLAPDMQPQSPQNMRLLRALDGPQNSPQRKPSTLWAMHGLKDGGPKAPDGFPGGALLVPQ